MTDSGISDMCASPVQVTDLYRTKVPPSRSNLPIVRAPLTSNSAGNPEPTDEKVSGE
ncbi:hypothetical protein [Haladaptatus sp. NG-WS-4]